MNLSSRSMNIVLLVLVVVLAAALVIVVATDDDDGAAAESESVVQDDTAAEVADAGAADAEDAEDAEEVSVLDTAEDVSVVQTSAVMSFDPIVSDASVHPMGSEEVIEGGSATLTRYPYGVSLAVHTADLTPGNVYTVWWVVFNDPGQCSDGACGENDVFLVDENGDIVVDEDGFEQLNMEQIERIGNSVLGATGSIIGESGEGHFSAHLGLGDVPGILWGPGLLNPRDAEIHIVLRSHGPADMEDPAVLNAQLLTFGGGCTLAPPGTGMLGSNECADEQDVIFMPPEV